MHQKRWNFGLGTIFSLIVIYFIYMYSKDKGWKILAFFSGWYLVLFGGLIILSLGIILLVMLFFLFMFLIGIVKMRRFKGKHRKNPEKYIDAEFKVKGQNE